MKLSQLSLADYNQLDSIPVINQDLSATDFTPVANTYYRHTGATTATFTQGVIYCYDGTEYKALDGSGGGGKSKSYRAMVSPTTWSSGTSGSVTLTSSGTYQIYMNDGKNNINFGVVYWDGSADTYTQAVFDSAHSGYFATIVGGVITAFDLSITGDSTTANTNTIYYRRIGI